MNSENDSAPRPQNLFSMRWLGFAIVGLLLFTGGWILRGWRQNPARSTRGQVVAVIGSEFLYEKDYTLRHRARSRRSVRRNMNCSAERSKRPSTSDFWRPKLRSAA